MSQPIIDFASDTGRQLLNRIAHKHRFPAYVLAASPDSLTPDSSSPDWTKFAQYYPQPRLSYCNPAATWLSCAYFAEQQEQLDPVTRQKIASRLQRAAQLWDIEADVQQIHDREQQLIKQAAETEERYPLRNAAEIEAAAQFLLREFDKQASERRIGCEDRVDLAGRLVDAGCQHERVRRAACRSGCYDAAKVASKLQAAAERSKVADERLPQLIRLVSQLEPQAMQQQQKTAAIIADQLGCFEEPAELAISVNTIEPVVFLANGCVVKQADLQHVSPGLMTAMARDQGASWLDHSLEARVKIASTTLASMADQLCRELVEAAGVPLEYYGRADSKIDVLDFKRKA